LTDFADEPRSSLVLRGTTRLATRVRAHADKEICPGEPATEFHGSAEFGAFGEWIKVARARVAMHAVSIGDLVIVSRCGRRELVPRCSVWHRTSAGIFTGRV